MDNLIDICKSMGMMEPFVLEIALDDVRHYTQSGEIITDVSGYGGGSASFGRIDPIVISTSVTDNKVTELHYLDQGVQKSCIFSV